MAEGPVVVKVGGSLFDLPDLGPRLRAWLAALDGGPFLLVPGGGAAADLVRDLDRCHGLGEETAHGLALQALSVTARFLHALLPGCYLVADAHGMPPGAGALAVLDPHPFVLADEGVPGCLPHSWDVTSDAIAARAAVVAGARRLVLLKSVTNPPGLTWEEAGRHGLVDRALATVLAGAPWLQAEAVNFRAWRPGPALPADGPARGPGRR
jgi:aspartokinase-like uncharacterized kinase